jgi:hypothetical protein
LKPDSNHHRKDVMNNLAIACTSLFLALVTLPCVDEPAETAGAPGSESLSFDDGSDSDSDEPSCNCPASPLPRVSNSATCGISVYWFPTITLPGVCDDGDCDPADASPCKWKGHISVVNTTTGDLTVSIGDGRFRETPSITIASGAFTSFVVERQAACGDTAQGYIMVRDAAGTTCQASFSFDCDNCAAAG